MNLSKVRGKIIYKTNSMLQKRVKFTEGRGKIYLKITTTKIYDELKLSRGSYCGRLA